MSDMPNDPIHRVLHVDISACHQELRQLVLVTRPVCLAHMMVSGAEFDLGHNDLERAPHQTLWARDSEQV